MGFKDIIYEQISEEESTATILKNINRALHPVFAPLHERQRLLDQECQGVVLGILSNTEQGIYNTYPPSWDEDEMPPPVKIPTYCLSHDWVDTGLKKTWCKVCDVEGEWTPAGVILKEGESK